MKRLFILCLIGLTLPAMAQNSEPSPKDKAPEVASTWPGIQMQVIQVTRIPDHRLLFGICLYATKSAPASTLIGTPGVRPPNPSPDEALLQPIPTPFSLDGSTMTEEQTQQENKTVTPIPHGHAVYSPSTLLASLSPGQAMYFSIQFPAPPPPPPDQSGKIPKQTVSILLPRAQGPIMHVVVPPKTPETSAANP